MPSLRKLIGFIVLIVLLALLFSSYRQIAEYQNSFDRREILIAGSIPAQVYLPDVSKPPIIVVAHGFTGDKEIMQSLAYSLVRDGFAVVTFDFRGHGQNAAEFDRARLQEDIAHVVEFAKELNENMPPAFGRGLKEVDTKRIALMGHSMGGGVVLSHAVDDSAIDSTVLISSASAAISGEVTEKHPKNLLIIYAENDPHRLRRAARDMLESATVDQGPIADTTYGSLKYGSARRLTMVGDRNHITILFSPDAQGQILDWLHQVWELPPREVQVSDPTVRWTGLAYLFSFLLFFACCHGLPWYLPTIAKRAGREVVLNLAAFAATCFIALIIIMLAPPLSFIPMPVGKYLVSYFFVAGIIYFLVASRRGNIDFAHFTFSPGRTVFVSVVLFLLVYVTFGTIATATWYRQLLTAQRLFWALVILPLLLPFFVAVEASFKRGSTLVALAASLAGVVITLGMLVVGVRLQLTPDFVMLIIVPITIFYATFQILSTYVYHLSRNYFTTALFNAMVMAWQFAVLFPIS